MIMIKLNESRTLSPTDVVECYRNLHKGMFSIRNKSSKLVVAIGDSFMLSNVTAKVSEGSRQRVLKEKRKNVHAVLIGEYIGECDIDVTALDELYYNPYTCDGFINRRTGEKLASIDRVYFYDNKCYIVK